MTAWTSPMAPQSAPSVPAFQPVAAMEPESDSAPAQARAAGRKVVALIPAGEVAGRDTVRWFAHDNPVKDQQDNYNSGDMFVYEASLRLLDFDSLEVVPLYSQLTDRDIDRLNDEASAAACFMEVGRYVKAARSFLAAGDKAGASRALQQIAEGSPDFERATLMLVPLLVEEGIFDGALHRRELLPQDPTVTGGGAVGAGVTVGRLIAASHLATGEAEPEVDPGVALLQAQPAAGARLGIVGNRLEVAADVQRSS